MSQSVAYLKPKARSSPQVIEYVWAHDPNAIIVDLSGSRNSKLNASNPVNKLTRVVNEDGVDTNVWTDSAGKLYNLDVSGNDISGAAFPLAFYVTGASGPVALSRVTGSTSRFNLPAFNVVDTLFTDQANRAYLDSYVANVPASLRNPSVDISLSALGAANNSAGSANFNFNSTDNSNNRVTMDLSAFRFNSYNPARYDICLNLNTGYLLSSYASAKADVSNQLIVNMHKFGFTNGTQTIVKFSSVDVQNATIDISVNVLSTSTIIKFDTSGAGVIAAQTAPLQPNVDLMNLVNSSYTFTKAGRQNLSIPIAIPANASGMWIWDATLVDGNLTSSSISVTLRVAPSFSAPVITLDPSTSSTLIPGLGEPAKFQVKLDDSSYTKDICNNLTRGMVVYPRINAVGARVPGDVTFANLDAGLDLIVNGSARALSATDLSTNTLGFVDISNYAINTGLIVTSADISSNAAGFDIKTPGRDVSFNITIDASSNDFNLPSRQFELLLDWLPNAQHAAFTNKIVPQTATIGTVNVSTAFTSNVNLVDNQDGTYSLSLTDLNGPLSSSSKYIVRVFSDADCRTSSSAFTLDGQSNISGASGNQFQVDMDANFNATFIGPKLNDRRAKLYMVAYLKNGLNTYLYTASPIQSIIFAKSPILNMTFDTTNALTAANLNQIVNVDDALELNSSIADLSGYLVKSINVGIDLSCNLSLPEWQLTNPTFTFTLNDSNGVVKSMDVSANTTRKSKVLPGVPATFTSLSDISNGLGFYVDLSFNAVNTSAIFTLNVALSDVNGTVYPEANKTVLFYYPGTFGVSETNLGGNNNTLIVFNDSKYALDAVSGITQMSIGSKDSFDTFTWLAGSPNNTFCLNLARTEFVGENHVLDASGFKIHAVDQTGVTAADPAALYVQFNGAWGSLQTGTVSTFAPIPCVFARNNYSWIDTRKFVGTIDIKYSTKDRNAKVSQTLNTLRLVVLPRPAVQVAIGNVPNVLTNTASTVQVTLTNTQKNKAGANISIGSWIPRDISGSKALNVKFRTLLNITSGALSLVTSAGTPDVPNAPLFTLPTVADMLYGISTVAPVTFKGRSTAGLVNTIVRANYSMNAARSVSSSAPLQVVVYSADSTFNNRMFTNSLSVNSEINFAGMPFVQYIALDNSNNSLALDVDLRTKNAAFVIVENKGSATSGNITHTVSSAITVLGTIPAGGVNVYSHTAPTGWGYLYSKV